MQREHLSFALPIHSKVDQAFRLCQLCVRSASQPPTMSTFVCSPRFCLSSQSMIEVRGPNVVGGNAKGCCTGGAKQGVGGEVSRVYEAQAPTVPAVSLECLSR